MVLVLTVVGWMLAAFAMRYLRAGAPLMGTIPAAIRLASFHVFMRDGPLLPKVCRQRPRTSGSMD